MNGLFILHYLCIFKYPNLQAQAGPDGEVSVVPGSQKSGSKPSDNGES